MSYDPFYCQSCGQTFDSLAAAGGHENHLHEGAQTCHRLSEIAEHASGRPFNFHPPVTSGP